MTSQYIDDNGVLFLFKICYFRVETFASKILNNRKIYNKPIIRKKYFKVGAYSMGGPYSRVGTYLLTARNTTSTDCYYAKNGLKTRVMTGYINFKAISQPEYG